MADSQAISHENLLRINKTMMIFAIRLDKHTQNSKKKKKKNHNKKDSTFNLASQGHVAITA